MPLGAFKAALMGTAGGVSTGDVVLLTSTTISADATVSFTSKITSTYGEYIFKFYYVHPETDGQRLEFNGSIDSGSNYNVVKTTVNWNANHGEAGGGANLSFTSAASIAQGTGFQNIGNAAGNANDEGLAGELHLFNPASTTYVKHFYTKTQLSSSDAEPYSVNTFTAGYFNTTSAIDAIQFKFASGDMDLGIIKMWGVK